MIAKAGEGLIWADLNRLVNVQSQIYHLSSKRYKKPRTRQLGGRQSRFLGRGMDYAESRHYLPGDDVRTIDWRVTARSGKLHTKLFEEEKQNPVMVWVDLRRSMLFGTQGRFKSVQAVELASAVLWKTLADGDRAGGFIQTDDELIELRPTSKRGAILHFLKQLSGKTILSPDTNGSTNDVGDSWRKLRRVSDASTRVVLISDFHGVDNRDLQQLAKLSHRAKLSVLQLTDPIEFALPEEGSAMVTDGSQRAQLRFGQRSWRQAYFSRHQSRQQRLKAFCSQHRAPYLLLTTSDPLAQNLRELGGVYQ